MIHLYYHCYHKRRCGWFKRRMIDCTFCKRLPGSRKAMMRGCTCPAVPNNYGKKTPVTKKYHTGSFGWWVSDTCREHAPWLLDFSFLRNPRRGI